MEESVIPVVVSGATGKMGREIVRTILERPDLRLVGALGHGRHLGEDIGEITTGQPCGVMVSTELEEVMEAARGGVLVEVSTGVNVKRVVLTAFAHEVACVVGTSNIPALDDEEMRTTAVNSGKSLLFAPNFALGAVLMMKFSAMAAKYFRWAEIVELHHERKLDAPSGTARRTAEMMVRARGNAGFRTTPEREESVKGARGGNIGGVHIHSVRLPGLLAHQEVMFGNTGELLTIKHDSSNRESFMAGVVLAVQAVRNVQGVVNGLESLLD